MSLRGPLTASSAAFPSSLQLGDVPLNLCTDVEGGKAGPKPKPSANYPVLAQQGRARPLQGLPHLLVLSPLGCTPGCHWGGRYLQQKVEGASSSTVEGQRVCRVTADLRGSRESSIHRGISLQGWKQHPLLHGLTVIAAELAGKVIDSYRGRKPW